MTARIQRSIRAVLDDGLIAMVRADLPLATLLEISDALLAAPILHMEAMLGTRDAVDAITLLSERHGENMWIGAGAVSTVQRFDAAVQAGAQFTSSHSLELPVVERALGAGILHLPGVSTLSEAQIVHRAGCRMVKLWSSKATGLQLMEAIHRTLHDLHLVPANGVTAVNAGDYARAGASAIALGSSLVAGPDQSLDELIRRARNIRAAWSGTAAAETENSTSAR